MTVNNLIDLTGDNYGRLTVIVRVGNDSKGRAMWGCLCLCGTSKSVLGSRLRSGHTSSCGCLIKDQYRKNLKDLTGRKFGKVSVLRRAPDILVGKSHRTAWECLCDCGKTCVIIMDYLKERTQNNCGCYKQENRRHVATKHGLSFDPKYLMISRAKHRAKVKGLKFTLSLDDITIPEHCPVLGIPLQRSSKLHSDNSPSLDRVRSDLGYVQGNVNVVSWRANTIKNDASLEEIQALVAYLSTPVESSTSIPLPDSPKRPGSRNGESKHPCSPRYAMWMRTKSRAKRLGIPFSLSLHDIEIPDMCPVFGIPLQTHGSFATPSSPSIDRIIPNIGYAMGNIVIMSNRANFLKSNATVDEMTHVLDYMQKHTPCT